MRASRVEKMIKIGIYAVLRGYVKMVSGKRSHMNLSGLFPASLNLEQIFWDHCFIRASFLALWNLFSRSDSIKRFAVSTTILVWRKQALMVWPVCFGEGGKAFLSLSGSGFLFILHILFKCIVLCLSVLPVRGWLKVWVVQQFIYTSEHRTVCAFRTVIGR